MARGNAESLTANSRELSTEDFQKYEKHYLECMGDAKSARDDVNDALKQFQQDHNGNPKAFKDVMRMKIVAHKDPIKGRIYWEDFKAYIALSDYESILAPMLGDAPGQENTTGMVDTTVKRKRGRPPGSKNKPRHVEEYSDNVTQFQDTAA